MLRLTCLIGCLMGCLLFLGASPARWIVQGHTTTVAAEINPSIPEPLKVTPLTMKTDTRRPGRTAAGNDAWVNEPLLQVENASGKAVKYLVVVISYPGAEVSGAQLPLMLSYGQVPGREAAREAEGPLQPGAKVNLTVSRNACGGVASRLLAQSPQPPRANRVATRINVVVFADGTAWFDGALNVRDGGDPLRWNALVKSSSRAAQNSAPLFRMTRTSYSAQPAPVSAQDSECGRQAGFYMMDCCDGFYVASAAIIPDPQGRFQLLPTLYTCPDDAGSCYFDQRVPCSSQ